MSINKKWCESCKYCDVKELLINGDTILMCKFNTEIVKYNSSCELFEADV